MALVVSERLRKIRNVEGKTKSERKEPFWKIRIENHIKKSRKDLNKMTEVRYCRAMLGEKGRGKSYGLSDKVTIYAIHFLKQLLLL